MNKVIASIIIFFVLIVLFSNPINSHVYFPKDISCDTERVERGAFNLSSRSQRDTDIVKVKFDDAHEPVYTVDPNNQDYRHDSEDGSGGYSYFADMLKDPSSFGLTSENNYEVSTIDTGQRINSQILEDCDVLIIANSGSSYTNSEINAVENYVKGGGGLLLIADHTSFPSDMQRIAMEFYVSWGGDVIRQPSSNVGPNPGCEFWPYIGQDQYWVYFDKGNMPFDPRNDPNYQNQEHEVYKITEDVSRVEYYCSNAFLQESTEAVAVILTDPDSTPYGLEPACLAIPNGNVTGAGRSVMLTDSNVFDNIHSCDDDQDNSLDFLDSDNEVFALRLVDWLAPGAYEVALISGEKDPSSGLPKPLVYIYEPGESHTFDIEVWNLGLRNDVIELAISDFQGNWTASLDKIETEELGTREHEMVRLTVTAPLTNVTDGEYALINVTATSMNDPENATARITSTNVIIVDLGFNVNWAVKTDANDEKKITVDPGKTTVATLGINNIGNINDTYRIELEGVPSDWGVNVDTSAHPEWVYDAEEITVTGISLSSYHFEDNTTGITVFFTPPVDAKEGETASITAMGESYLSLLSEQDAKGDHDDDIIIEVSAYRAIQLVCEESVKYVDPGKTVNFLVSVQNNGNSRENVAMELGTLMSGWAAAVDMPVITLQARQKKTVSVTTMAPEGAIEGSRCVLEVKANMASVDKVVDSTCLTSIVNRYCLLDASLGGSDHYRLDPGGKISLNLTVTNLGNGITGANLYMAQLPESWDFSFFLEGFPVDNIVLNPHEAIELRLDITASENALCDAFPETDVFDPYEVIVNISGEENFKHLSLDLEINRRSSITVFCPNGIEVTEPGSRVLYHICIRNNGNAWDEVELAIDDIPEDIDTGTGLNEGWGIYFSAVSLVEQTSGIKETMYVDFAERIDATVLDTTSAYWPNNTKEELIGLEEISLRIPRKTMVWVSVMVEVPGYARARDESFNITSKCLTLMSLHLPTMEPVVSIKNADLSFFGDIILQSEISPGDLVSVMVYVKNNGDIRAENVPVTLYEDGVAVATMPVHTILAGRTQLVAFTWKVPGKEKCDLKVVIDPHNSIVEKNEGDNLMTVSVEISGSSELLFGLGGWIVGSMGAAVALIAVVSTVWWLRRKRMK